MSKRTGSKVKVDEALAGASERVLKLVGQLYEQGLSSGAIGAVGLKAIAGAEGAARGRGRVPMIRAPPGTCCRSPLHRRSSRRGLVKGFSPVLALHSCPSRARREGDTC